MSKKKKKVPQHETYRKLKVGEMKRMAGRLAEMIVDGEIPLDKTVIFNSIIDIAGRSYCSGYERKSSERKAFKVLRDAAFKKEWDAFQTEMSDMCNKKDKDE